MIFPNSAPKGRTGTTQLKHISQLLAEYIQYLCIMSLFLKKRSEILGYFFGMVSNCFQCQIVRGVKLSAVLNCPVSNCPRCQIVLVSNCPRIPTDGLTWVGARDTCVSKNQTNHKINVEKNSDLLLISGCVSGVGLGKLPKLSKNTATNCFQGKPVPKLKIFSATENSRWPPPPPPPSFISHTGDTLPFFLPTIALIHEFCHQDWFDLPDSNLQIFFSWRFLADKWKHGLWIF